MSKLCLYNVTNVNNFFNKRRNDIKFGEHINVLSASDDIYAVIGTLDVQYVLIGLPEDVGVFSNYGKSGSYNTWHAVIKMLLNTQNNVFNDSKKVSILGYLDCSTELKKISKFDQKKEKDIKKAREIVSKIDKEVVNIVSSVIKAGKTPILIGGGHNNAYGNIKGTALALKKAINCINFDAHTDFRALEGRHSGNGFSYAYAEGFLDHYFVFGLHENYTPNYIIDRFESEKRLNYNTYEALMIRQDLNFNDEMQRALKHVNKKPFGVEIDCDAIVNTKSSAQTPSGFSVEKTRQFIHYFGSHKNAVYLHICEAIATNKNEAQIGKLIAYLITDFIRANSK